MEAEAHTGAGTEVTAVQTALLRIEEARTSGHSALALSGLGLSDLPDELRALIALQELDLSDNELTAVPSWLGAFPNLRVLDLRRNHLVEVPWQVGTLGLTSLELDGNPHLLLPPPETIAQGTEAILAHLRASAPLREGAAAPGVLGLSAAAAATATATPDDGDGDGDSSDQGPDALLAPIPSAASASSSGPISGTVSRAAAVGGAAVLLLAAVAAAAAVGSGGSSGHNHQAGQSAPSGPGSAPAKAAGLAADGVAGSLTSSSPSPTTPGSTLAPSTPLSTAAAPPSSALQPPVVTVTDTAAPIVHSTHLPGTPAPSSTVRVVVTKTVAPVVTRTTTAAPVHTTTAAPKAPTGPVPVSAANATGPLVGIGGMCVDVYASNTADYSEIDLWDCNGTGAQNFSWVEAGSTLHVLGKCLDVQGSGTADGTTVDLYDCNGTGAQVFIPRSDGTLYNPESDKCLDDPNGSTNRGTALEIWDCHSGVNQKWQLP